LKALVAVLENNAVDSSAWLEYFADTPNAPVFAAAIEDTPHLIVPAICIYEVYKRVLQQYSAVDAAAVTAAMRMGRVIELDADLAIIAAQTAIAEKLAMADAIILATAHATGAVLWTQDAHFEGIAGVAYHPKSLL